MPELGGLFHADEVEDEGCDEREGEAAEGDEEEDGGAHPGAVLGVVCKEAHLFLGGIVIKVGAGQLLTWWRVSTLDDPGVGEQEAEQEAHECANQQHQPDDAERFLAALLALLLFLVILALLLVIFWQKLCLIHFFGCCSCSSCLLL